MGKAKRVRFVDDATDDFLNDGRNNYSNQEAAAEVRMIDGPKTSEYAFFKKIKKDAGYGYSRSKREVGKESKSVEFSNHQPGQPVGGASLSDKFKSRKPDAKFSSPAGTERNAEHYSFISPLNVGGTKSATKWQSDTLDRIKPSTSSLPPGKLTPVGHNVFFSPTSSASANKGYNDLPGSPVRSFIFSGNQYFGKGVFAEKRSKLHQHAVDILFPDLGEGCSKGFHIVSKLLNRLRPNGCENDEAKVVEPTMDATDRLFTLSTSYSSQKKVHLVHKNTSMDLKNDSSFDDMFPTYLNGITKKDLASEREDSLAIYDTGANFLEYGTDPQLIRRYQKSNSSAWFPYEKMRTKSFYIQELDEYTDPSKARKREPQNFLLDWDFGREKEKDEFYLPACDVEDSMCSTFSISRIGHNQQFIGDKLDEIVLPSLSIRQICPKYDLMPYWQPNCFDTQNAKGLLEYGHQDDLEPTDSPSRLSFTPKYLTLAEDIDINNVLERDSSALCFQDDPSCTTNVFSYRPQHAVERQLTSYYSSHSPQRELPTSYLLDNWEFGPGLYTSKSRKTNVLFSEDAFTHQDSLSDSSCWDEPHIPEEDYN